MMGAFGGTGSAVLDLSRALTPTLAPQANLTLSPLHTGHPAITLAGDRFDILWPPPIIDITRWRALANAVHVVEQLAEDLAQDGHPELSERLRTAMRAAEAAAENEAREEGDCELPDDEDVRDIDLAPTDDADDEGTEDEDLPGLIDLPAQWRNRYQRVLRRIRAANNNLSLVLASQTGKLICFGDISGAALAHVLTTRLADRAFDVMLAPHHGSHNVHPDMPWARWCISQCGTTHVTAWRSKHPGAPLHATACRNTHDDGEFWGPPLPEVQ